MLEMSLPYKLVCLGLEGTVIRTKSGDRFRRDVHDWVIPERVLEKIDELVNSQIGVALITNQAGPFWKAVTGGEKYPAPQDLGQTFRAVDGEITQKTGVMVPWFISLYDKRALDLLDQQNRAEIYAEKEMPGTVFELLHGKAQPVDGGDLLRRLQREMSANLFSHAGYMNTHIGISPEWRLPAPGAIHEAMLVYGVHDKQKVLFVGSTSEEHEAAYAAGIDYASAEHFFQ